jgi:hypothetical protein
MADTRKLTSSNHERSHRVIACLNRDQVDFLDKLGKDALFSAGVKLSRTHILSAMVNALREVHLNGEGIHSPEQFEQRILAMLHKSRGGKTHA